MAKDLGWVALAGPWLPCPFCTGQINVDHASAIPAVYHTTPHCADFGRDEDALDFLTRCNDKLGVKRS